VTYLGYPGTLGARYIDYIVADAVTIPPENECFFSEKVVRLPGSFMPIDRTGRGEISASRAQEGLPEDAVVFCAFANAYKIGPEVFAVWLRLLKEIEGSVLWLSVAKPEARTNLLAEAARQAIAAERIVFARFINERSQHLARVGLADLYLDTPVYGGHSTATDLLWAGVPVVTCRGNSFGARVAASLLTVADTPELIAASLAEYETIARELARGAERRAALKGRILAGRSRLFDTERLCRSLELAYETMKQHRLSGRHESFSVAT
jgi:predicted O-linked N-acetylglucosamine transferase (SPINDLY family)